MLPPVAFNTITYKFAPSQKSKGGSFCARPEYERLMRSTWGQVLVSNFFRRGFVYNRQDSRFIDVINALKILFQKNDKPKILVAGLGKAQEPFSILAVIKDLVKDKPLQDALDLHCVDLQPKMPDEALDRYTYLNDAQPLFAQGSFDFDPCVHDPAKRYKIKPEIVEYLRAVFNNPQKTKWDTSIEEFATSSTSNAYDMVSVNNVFGYFKEKKLIGRTLNDICRSLKAGGILITDVSDDYYKTLFPNLAKFKNLAPGIWQKPS